MEDIKASEEHPREQACKQQSESFPSEPIKSWEQALAQIYTRGGCNTCRMEDRAGARCKVRPQVMCAASCTLSMQTVSALSKTNDLFFLRLLVRLAFRRFTNPQARQFMGLLFPGSRSRAEDARPLRSSLGRESSTDLPDNSWLAGSLGLILTSEHACER